MSLPWVPVHFRPYRYKCGEAGLRDGMTDEEFWEHVFGREGWAPDDWDDDGPSDPIEARWTTTCSECGALGACAYDAEGRPLIHAVDVDGD